MKRRRRKGTGVYGGEGSFGRAKSSLGWRQREADSGASLLSCRQALNEHLATKSQTGMLSSDEEEEEEAAQAADGEGSATQEAPDGQ